MRGAEGFFRDNHASPGREARHQFEAADKE